MTCAPSCSCWCAEKHSLQLPESRSAPPSSCFTPCSNAALKQSVSSDDHICSRHRALQCCLEHLEHLPVERRSNADARVSTAALPTLQRDHDYASWSYPRAGCDRFGRIGHEPQRLDHQDDRRRGVMRQTQRALQRARRCTRLLQSALPSPSHVPMLYTATCAEFAGAMFQTDPVSLRTQHSRTQQ